MFPIAGWDFTPTLGWENPPRHLSDKRFPQFPAIGTLLD
jgi:hypothetical protein